ncbi:putative sigma-54 modulation protein [Oribacterium sp. KHPX15]|uniref:ribosome hibernation-promoting factor, HPF/YfiA family n=1 Tax=unclassified Oribacterium TaxID=2629782 RepID=UPI0004E25004|nr:MULTISPECIES: ribosome-associated translation inhibitor RaiA [unclassified Oribacterium]MCR5007432.1 ribosome-associated translation inhibitor RaiA [Oribacterium sp.]SEA08137.1 putative sigma-54 modulation protein [Oribacterium sp. KHPX15]
MKFNITGRNINVSDGMKDQIDRKLGKLSKFFKEDTICNVTLSTEKNMYKVEVTIPVKDGVIRAEETTSDKFQSLDLVVDIIERQIRKYRTKLLNRHQAAADFSDAFNEEPDDTNEEEINIVRTKHFDLKPMTPEEACLQMELVGHAFFVFQNGDTGNVAVVYKRKGNSYGLIEPEY